MEVFCRKEVESRLCAGSEAIYDDVALGTLVAFYGVDGDVEVCSDILPNERNLAPVRNDDTNGVGVRICSTNDCCNSLCLRSVTVVATGVISAFSYVEKGKASGFDYITYRAYI